MRQFAERVKIMTELEIMQRAKQYIDALANGFDPLSGKPVPEGDTVNQVRISRCLFYVSGVLQKVIDNGGEVQKTPRSQKAPLSLTAEQLAQLKPHTSRLSASKVTAAVNSLIDTEKMQRLKVTVLVRWLVSAGSAVRISAADSSGRLSCTLLCGALPHAVRSRTEAQTAHICILFINILISAANPLP